jgi:replicative DNA helicase
MQKINSTHTKIPPNSIEAEQAILASLLIDNKAIDRIIDILENDDFYHPYNQLLYSTILELNSENKPLDLVTLIAKLEDKGQLAEAGGYEYISSIVDIIPNASNIVHYAEIAKEKAILRKLIDISTEMSERSFNYVGDINELLDEAERRIFKLAEYKLRNEIKPLSQLITEAFHSLETLYQSPGHLTGIPSDFIDLDKITNGFQPSDFIIIAGRPAMGKTAFALNIAMNASSKYKKSVAVFSLEMSSGQLVQRLIGSEARISSTKLKNGKLTMEEWQNLASIGGKLSEAKLFIDDTAAISAMELRAKCRRIKREHGLDLVIIDYLQLMGGSRAENREQQISEISRSLKALAKELNIPVIALSQLNRSVESRADRRPYPSDLRESGAIEQDADLILFLYRDEVYNKDTKFPGIAEVIISKHRNGPTGTVYLTFLKQFTRFENSAIESVEQ